MPHHIVTAASLLFRYQEATPSLTPPTPFYLSPNLNCLRDHAAETYRCGKPGTGILVDLLDAEDEAGRGLPDVPQ